MLLRAAFQRVAGVRSIVGVGVRRVVLFGVLPLICVITVATAVLNLGPTWHAWRGEGQPGVLVIERAEPRRGSCTYFGAWTSTDGSRTLPNVASDYESDCYHEVGDELQVIYVGDDTTVYKKGDLTFFLVITFLVLALGYLTGLALYVRQRSQRMP